MHFSGIISDYRQSLRFSKHFGEIPTKCHQNLASKWQNSIKKCLKLNNSLFIFEKSFTAFNRNFDFAAVQRCVYFVDLEKCCKTQNEYLVAKIGFDTDENEPSKVGGSS